MTALNTDLFARPSWHAEGACRDEDPAMFFPERGKDTKPAKAICADCPVRIECLDYALETRVKHGIWGGLSERERRPLRRARNAERRAAAS